MMTLRFHMDREDALAFNQAYFTASPTYRRAQTRSRFLLPGIMVFLWILSTSGAGFRWSGTVIYLGIGLGWLLLFPVYYKRVLNKHWRAGIDEGSYGKNFGDYEVTLTEGGLESSSPAGKGSYHWSYVDRASLTDSHLFIFLSGPLGYPIPIRDIGQEAATAACEYINNRKRSGVEQAAR